MNPIDALRQAATVEALTPDPWKLRCLRELRGVKQHALGQFVGWAVTAHSCPTISRIENYSISFGLVRSAELAKALGVEPDSLLSTTSEYESNRATFHRWSNGPTPLRSFLLSEAERSR